MGTCFRLTLFWLLLYPGTSISSLWVEHLPVSLLVYASSAIGQSHRLFRPRVWRTPERMRLVVEGSVRYLQSNFYMQRICFIYSCTFILFLFFFCSFTLFYTSDRVVLIWCRSILLLFPIGLTRLDSLLAASLWVMRCSRMNSSSSSSLALTWLTLLLFEQKQQQQQHKKET